MWDRRQDLVRNEILIAPLCNPHPSPHVLLDISAWDLDGGRYRVFQNIWTPCNYNELPGRVILLPGQGMGGTKNSHPRDDLYFANVLLYSGGELLPRGGLQRLHRAGQRGRGESLSMYLHIYT